MMLQKRKKTGIKNLIAINLFGLLLAGADLTFGPHTIQNVSAQGGIQVRANQWLQVDQISGKVTYRNFYNYANRPARVGDRLQAVSDEISTGANSSAVLTVDTAVGSIYMSENTTVKINSFRVASDNGRITNLFVPRGKARLQIRKFTNRGSQLNIQTPSGISGVRGTGYIVTAKSNGSMVVTTLSGSVATTAQNQTKLVNGGFENLTFVGEPPSTPVPINNDPNLRYVIIKESQASKRFIVFRGYTSPFNVVTVDGKEQSLDRNGNFSMQFPATSSLKVNVKVETPQGSVQVYEIPIL